MYPKPAQGCSLIFQIQIFSLWKLVFKNSSGSPNNACAHSFHVGELGSKIVKWLLTTSLALEKLEAKKQAEAAEKGVWLSFWAAQLMFCTSLFCALPHYRFCAVPSSDLFCLSSFSC